MRFVLSPEGEVAPDFTGKLPGRGAWVTASRQALDAARRKGAFSRAFKTSAPASDDLTARVEAGLAARAMSALGLARKAGEAVAGFEKVRAALKDKDIAVLAEAADGAEDGKRKLRALAKGVEVVGWLSADELSAALGRDGVVHVALQRGAAASRFAREARRLAGFRLETGAAAG